jgi:regulation of enolase protein 1 (concanavalin A-like superfamily)
MNDSKNEKWIVITTVNKPTDNFRESFYKFLRGQNWSIVVVGDVNTLKCSPKTVQGNKVQNGLP